MKTLGTLALMFSIALFAVGCKDKSPEGVCKHFVEVTEPDDADEALKDCTGDLTKMKEKMGDDKWDEFAGCALDADSEESMRKCMKD